MIKSVEVRNPLGEDLVMTLANPFDNGINITKIDGLSPGQAVINSLEIPGFDGAIYNSSRLPGREITMYMDFLPAPDVESTRMTAYKYFPLEEKVELKFVTDKKTTYISGYVKNFDVDIFSPKESSVITIFCHNPLFSENREGLLQVNSFSSKVGGFEFPFSNPQGQKTLMFSNLLKLTEQNFFYPGDLKTGAFLTFEAIGGDVVSPRFYNTSLNQFVGLKNFTLKPGNLVHVNTYPGHKILWCVGATQNFTPTQMLKYFDPDGTWLQLKPGDNNLAIDAPIGLSYLNVTLMYYVYYRGI